jgi:hypothetical protein
VARQSLVRNFVEISEQDQPTTTLLASIKEPFSTAKSRPSPGRILRHMHVYYLSESCKQHSESQIGVFLYWVYQLGTHAADYTENTLPNGSQGPNTCGLCSPATPFMKRRGLCTVADPMLAIRRRHLFAIIIPLNFLSHLKADFKAHLVLAFGG